MVLYRKIYLEMAILNYILNVKWFVLRSQYREGWRAFFKDLFPHGVEGPKKNNLLLINVT